MRIAWTGPVGTGGGVPGMGTLILEEMLEQGVEVDLYLPLVGAEPPPLKPSPRLRIIEHRSHWRWSRWYSRSKAGQIITSLAARTFCNVLLSIKLLLEHRRRPYDAVYQLSTTELFLLGRARRFAPPIVVHPCTHAAGELRWHRAEREYALQVENHFLYSLMRAMLAFRSWLQPKELARAQLVLGLSDRFNELVHQDYDVPLSKLRVVRTPVDVERFNEVGAEEKAKPQTLLFISRISTRKGVEEIIELSHRLNDLAGTVKLMVIGGPTQWSDYTEHLSRLNPAVAEYVGSVHSTQLPAVLRSATMLVVPSRYEPGSIATVEALACGLPVVLSDEVGAGEVVRGPHVRFHQAGDVDGLESAVRSLLVAASEDGPALRASARANAVASYAPAKVVGELIRLIASVRSGVDVPGPPKVGDPIPFPESLNGGSDPDHLGERRYAPASGG
jgi:glycosyltransferase involved in cell wall biosynthesis